jgi:hypothetical protein
MDALRFSLVVVFAFNAALPISSNLVQKKIEKLEQDGNELSNQNKRCVALVNRCVARCVAMMNLYLFSQKKN